MAGWVAALPAGTGVVLDPGPLVGDIEPALLDAVLARATWLSLNDREARLATGAADAGAARQCCWTARPTWPGSWSGSAPEGALLGQPGSPPVTVPGVPVDRVVDTNGAGDVHLGTFVAALAAGLDPVASVARGQRRGGRAGVPAAGAAVTDPRLEPAPLVASFAGALQPVVDVVGLYVGGSLAAGDYRPGTSDLDLAAVLTTAPGPDEQAALTRLHEALIDADPAAVKLHCFYLARGGLDDDPARRS